ncbi:hypothetical protein ABBQ32_010200 [Trebouxia sp. C0010 RCD-2024]
MGTKNFENCQPEGSQKAAAEETMLLQEGVMVKAMARRLGGYSGYNEYRPGYGAQNYTGSGMGGGGAYRGGRGAGDGGQMNNQNNPLWAAQGYPVTGPGGWTQYRAPDSGEAYYHNGRTGETTWDKPAGWGP